MATAQERTNIIKLVTSMFNAAPGATYLADLVTFFDTSSGTSNQKLASLSVALSNTTAYKTLNPSFQTAAEFASAFLTPFGLQANAEAVDFITTRFNAGVSKGQISFEAASAIDGSTSPVFADAKAILVNKAVVGEYFSVTKAIAQTSISSLQSVVANVTAATSSVTAANTAIDNGAGSNTAVTTFTLTTGIDNISGTSGNDTILADNLNMSASDVIVGGAGIDTLSYTDGSATGATVPAASVSGVEILNVRNVNTALVGTDTVAATNFFGATDFNSTNSTKIVNFTGLSAGQKVGIVGNGIVVNGNVGVDYAATVTAGVINVSGGTTTGTITETGAGITSNTINSSGAANTLTTVILSGTNNAALTINAATNLTTGGITGFQGTTAKITVAGAAASVNIGAVENLTVKTIDASGLTAGGLTAILSTNTGIVLTGGAGNDVITAGSVLVAGASVDAGAGTADRLVITATAQLSTATAPFYKGFEVLQANTGVIADVTQLAANNTITGIRINDNASSTVAVNGLSAAQAANVAIIAANDATGAITLGLTGASNGGQIDTVNATLTTTAAGAAQVSNLTGITLVGVEKLVLTGTGTADATTGLITVTTTNATSLDSIKLTTVGAASITVSALHTAQNLNIDGSASSGALFLDGRLYPAGTTTGLTLTGGSGKDVLLGSASAVSRDNLVGGGNNDSLAGEGGTIVVTANAAADLFTAIGANTAGDILNGGSGNNVYGISSVVALANFDTIVGLNFGTTNLAGQVDRIQIGASTATGTASSVVTFTAGDQAAITAAADFATAVSLAAGNATLVATAKTVATFTYGADTYLITNGVAGGVFDVATDTVIKITGVTGTLDVTDILFI